MEIENLVQMSKMMGTGTTPQKQEGGDRETDADSVSGVSLKMWREKQAENEALRNKIATLEEMVEELG